MDNGAIIITIILSVVVALIFIYLLYLTLVYLAVTKRMYIRYNGHPLLKYFTHEDFPGLKAEAISFTSKNKITLRGFIYSTAEVKDFSKVIIFFHGLGNGHLAYTKEINRLVRDNNLAVIAYDNTGTGQSEGKTIIDLARALVDADYFLKYLKSDSRFAHSKFILIGHSWGGFVAGNLVNIVKDERIKQAIVLNALPSIGDVSARFTKGKAFARVFYIIISRIKMGKYANQSLLKTLQKHKLNTMVVHGALDPLVPLKYMTPIYKYAGAVDFIRPLIYPSHHHFVYLSEQGETALMELQTNLKQLSADKLTEYTKTLDYDLIGQHNEQLFATIQQFISRG